MIHLERIRLSVLQLGFLLAMSGLILSRAMISIGMGLIILQALMHPKPFKNLRLFVANPSFVLPTLVFFIFLLSGLYSENLEYFTAKMQVKLPFLLLPFAFFSVPSISQQSMKRFLAVFALLILGSSLVVLGKYLMNYEQLTAQYLHAKTLDTPFCHIRYSLMVAFALIMSGYLYFEKFRFWFKWEPAFYGGITIFLFLFIHLLAVRSGLFSLYVVLGFLAVRYLWLSRNWKRGVALIAAMVVLPMLAYLLMPTFHNKVTYMVKDLHRYVTNTNISYYSDARRLVSWEAGWAIATSAPLIGVGYGDLKDETEAFYRSHYPDFRKESYLIPHNQMLLVFAATGIVGLLLFCLFLMVPIFHHFHYKHVPFVVINLILWSSFLVEPTLEVQIGVAFYLLFYLLFLKTQSLISA
jgi:O-antigen ligase